MSERTRAGIGILVVGLLAGLAGDLLLRRVPWGIGWPLWVLLLVGALVVLARRLGVTVSPAGRLFMVIAVLFALPLGWRDSPTLNGTLLLGTLSALVLASRYARFGAAASAGWLDYAAAGVASGFQATLGVPLVMASDIFWGELPRRSWLSLALGSLRGVALAVPLLLVFGLLLAAADAAFAAILSRLFDVDWEEIFAHLLLISVWSWLAVGFLRQTLVGPDLPSVRVPAGFLRLGHIELWIVLGALNLLFLGFVLVQLRYLFGGAELIEASVSLSYAEYARRGFFELTAAAALLLPTLLLLDWLSPELGPLALRLYRLLLMLLVGLLFVVLFSAAQRMRLYVDEFGLSELRMYTSAFMGWLSLLFLWFAVTVVGARRERFAFGALLSAYAIAAALTFANPDDLIVRVNVARSPESRPFDADYAASLSADAVPALLTALPQMLAADRATVARQLVRRWSPPAYMDWRGLNWSREEARRLVGAREAELRTLAGTVPSR